MTCIICGEKSKYRYSLDIGIRGIGACEKHKDEVKIAYMILILKGKKEFEEYIENYKRRIK